MNISGKVLVKIDWEQEGEIVREILRADYNRLLNDVVALMARDNLEDFEKQNMMDNIEFMRGFLKTLEFYSVYEDHQAWVERQNGISAELAKKISG